MIQEVINDVMSNDAIVSSPHTVRMRNGWEGEVQMEGGECGPHEVVVYRVLPKGERPSPL